MSYVPRNADDAEPSADEDRTGNRLTLAARLIGVLRARGEDVDRELTELRAAQTAFDARDRAKATELVEALLGRIESRSRTAPSSPSER